MEPTHDNDAIARMPATVLLDGADADAIERAVKQVWRAAAIDAHSGVLRASVLNLAIAIDSAAQLEDVFQTLGELANTHPARAVVVAPDPEMPPGTCRSEISMQCSFVPGFSKHVCTERIVLRAAPDCADGLGQTVVALSVDELRRFLWWRRSCPPSGPLHERLAAEADHVVVDSRRLPPGAATFALLAAHAEPSLRDLSWSRLTPWRDILAQVFDPPAMREPLARIECVEIAHVPDAEGARTNATLLLTAWLAERLGWTAPAPHPEPGVEGCAFTRPDGGTVGVRFVPRPCGTHPLHLAGIRLDAAGQSPVRVSLRRADDMQTAQLCVGEGADACKVVDMAPMRDPEALARELDYWGRDEGYGRVLRLALQIAEVMAPMTPDIHTVADGSDAAPEIRVFDGIDALAQGAAETTLAIVHEALKRRGRCSIALAGGSTPATLYRLLGSPAYQYAAPWDQVHFFWGDERCVPPDHPESNYLLARTAMLDFLGVPQGRIHRMRGEEDPDRAAEMYEREIRDTLETSPGFAPRFDLVMLGMGADGHTASLFPSGLELGEKQRWVISTVKPGGWRRVTLTLPVLTNAHNTMFLVAGEGKAGMVRRALFDPPSHEVPAGLVRPVGGRLLWLMDGPAASAIRDRIPGERKDES